MGGEEHRAKNYYLNPRESMALCDWLNNSLQTVAQVWLAWIDVSSGGNLVSNYYLVFDKYR